MINEVSSYVLLSMYENFGGTVNFDNKTFTIKWGKFEIKGVKFPWIKALAKNSSLIEEILSTFFINKRIMWFDLSSEKTEDCVRSLEDLINELGKKIELFSVSNKHEDLLVGSQLRVFQNTAINCLKSFKSSIRNAEISKGEIDKSEWHDSEEDIPKILSEFRTASYPIIEGLTELLNEKNPIKSQAVNKINEGKDVLIRNYKTNSNKFEIQTWDEEL